MQVFVRVRSEYFSAELSAHRLNMTSLTLIASLQRQSDTDFTVVLQVVANDPHLRRRIQRWGDSGLRLARDVEPVDRVEICVDDDAFVGPRVVQLCRHAAKQSQIPRMLSFPNGHVFQDGRVFTASQMYQFVYGTVHRGGTGSSAGEDIEVVTTHPSWVYVDHVNRIPYPDLEFYRAQEPLKGDPWWTGFSRTMIRKSAETKAILGTAVGYDDYPETRGLCYARNGTKGRR